MPKSQREERSIPFGEIMMEGVVLVIESLNLKPTHQKGHASKRWVEMNYLLIFGQNDKKSRLPCAVNTELKRLYHNQADFLGKENSSLNSNLPPLLKTAQQQGLVKSTSVSSNRDSFPLKISYIIS